MDDRNDESNAKFRVQKGRRGGEMKNNFSETSIDSINANIESTVNETDNQLR